MATPLIGKIPFIDLISNIVIPKKFKIERYPYSILKIIPYKTGYTAKDFEKVMNTLSKYNNTLLEKFAINKDEKTLVYHPNQPMCYEILFTKEKITFSFAVPNIYKSVFMNKLRFLFGQCDIIETEDYIEDFVGGTKYRLDYAKNWMFSLNTDDKLNVSDSLIVISKDLKNKQDKALLQYMMQPLFDYQWKMKWHGNYNKYNSTGILPGNFSPLGLLDKVLDFTLYQVDMLLNAIISAICGDEPILHEESKHNFSSELSNSTKHKVVFDGFKTNINLFIRTDDGVVLNNVSRNIETIAKDLDDDNSLKMSKGKKITHINRVLSRPFIANTLECKQFIKTPSEQALSEYEDLLDKNNVSDVEINKDLLNKGVQFGEIVKGSIYKPVYFGDDLDSNSKVLCYIGAQGCGKSEFSRRYAINYAEKGDSVVIFDTIDRKSYETVRDYLSIGFPEEKIICLDFGDENYAYGLMWNEISDIYLEKIQKETNDISKYRLMEQYSSIISSQFKSFIDTIQIDSREQMLTPAMSKILNSIAQLVFMNDKPISVILDCLYDVELRHRLLKNLSLPMHLPFCRDILKIDDEPENSGTLKGIESRLNLLMDNLIMKKYFSVSPKNKLKFDEWINNGYVILINVPENKFGENINPIITFLMQKIWMCMMSSRTSIPEDKRRLCHIILDEIHRYPYCMSLLQNKILESRKWRVKFLFFLHNMATFGRVEENLKASGASFILMPSSEFVFGRISSFFYPYGQNEAREVEKLNAKYPNSRFVLSSVHYKNVNYPMIVKLHKPVSQCFKKTDRSHLDKKYSHIYGVKQDEYYNQLFSVSEHKKDTIDHDKLII